jgi:hypothetical protein
MDILERTCYPSDFTQSSSLSPLFSRGMGDNMDIDPQIQVSEVEILPQNQPLPGQVSNPVGGYSYLTTDICKLKRFLCLGTEQKFYVAGRQHRKFYKSDVQSIDR